MSEATSLICFSSSWVIKTSFSTSSCYFLCFLLSFFFPLRSSFIYLLNSSFCCYRMLFCFELSVSLLLKLLLFRFNRCLGYCMSMICFYGMGLLVFFSTSLHCLAMLLLCLSELPKMFSAIGPLSWNCFKIEMESSLYFWYLLWSAIGCAGA